MVLSLSLVLISPCARTSDQKQAAPDGQSAARKTLASPTITNTLRRELFSEPKYLNPVISNDANASMVERLIFDSMIDIDKSQDSNLIPRLAEKWEIIDQGRIYIFHLRSDVYWHDGKPFTAEDVKFSFDTALRKDIPAFSLASLEGILKSVELCDRHTIRFIFNYPFSPGLSTIGTTNIVPKHLLDEAGLARETRKRNLVKPVTFLTSEFNRKPVGTGPYRVHQWQSGREISLVASQNYWDKAHQPRISKVVIKFVPNRTLGFNMIQKGELDVFNTRPNQYLQFMRMKHLHQEYQALTFFESKYFYIGWNMRSNRKFFYDSKVRRAMTLALDRNSIIDKAFFGLGKQITGPFYFKSWAYNPQIQPLPYDVEKAARLLKEAGWSDHDGDGLLDREGVHFEFELLVPAGSQSLAQLGAIVQADLKKLSIEVHLTNLEWNLYLERLQAGNFDACVGGWYIGADPDIYSLWHSSQIDKGNNFIAYANQAVDHLLEEGEREFERQKRQKVYWKMHALIHEDQPYTFVFTPKVSVILARKIKNYDISPFGLFEFFPGQLVWTLE
ncbi:peptide-binding protein [candidate division CSSED10-310 bacterium]|uniref:Peptide-binding protein n=1 Tax=candidate division CSSED10-310 bacterium TaxID=2855610 RepID=A0ABV6YSG3_UNCC1